MTKAEPARILVIDDEEIIRRSLAAILEEEGYVVDTAKNGQSAIEKSKTRPYDLALIDIRLPDMDGTALLSALDGATPRMIKIMLTGYPSLENAIEAVNKGADAYIVKPFAVPKLLETVKEHLKKKQAATKYTEKEVAEYIETRAKELESRT